MQEPVLECESGEIMVVISLSFLTGSYIRSISCDGGSGMRINRVGQFPQEGFKSNRSGITR